jgi:hypothetical protein
VDLRETPDPYLLNGEFASIQGRDTISLQWIESRTLRVQVTVHKVDLKKEWDIDVLEEKDDS